MLYLDSDGNYTAKQTALSTGLQITKIGKYAYGVTKFAGLDVFAIGKNIKEIEEGGIYASAYRSSTVLSNINQLDLANVEIVGKYAC